MGRRIALILSLCMLASCGGGSDKEIEGVWKGTYTPDVTPQTFHAVIQAGGKGFFFDNSGLVWVLPPLAGNSLNVNATIFPPYGFIFTGKRISLPSDITGDASNGQLSGKLIINGAFAEFAMKPNAPFSGQAEIKAGTWDGRYLGDSSSADVDLVVDADGTFRGQDGYFCSMTGTISSLGAGENLFAVSLNATGASSICGGEMTGLLYESSKDEVNLFGHIAGTYYYMAVSGDKAAFVAELKLP